MYTAFGKLSFNAHNDQMRRDFTSQREWCVVLTGMKHYTTLWQ